MDNFKERLEELFRNRLAVILLVIAAVFIMLVCRLFNMQIVNGEEANANLTASVTREVTIPAARGNIYDRYGRVLASNTASFSVEVDDSITVEYDNREELVTKTVNELRDNGYVVADMLPITKNKPYQFTISGEDLTKWKRKAGLNKKQMNLSAEEILDILYENYGISNANMTDEEKRAVVSFGVGVSDKNLMYISLILLIESKGGAIADELPITETEPYYFTIDNENEINRWKTNVSMEGDELSYTAAQSMDYLIDLFGIPQNISSTMQRKLAAVRYSVYLQRYRRYQPVTVARDVNDEIIAAVQENLDIYPGVSIETESNRVYDEGEVFSNIIGYIRRYSRKNRNGKGYGASAQRTGRHNAC